MTSSRMTKVSSALLFVILVAGADCELEHLHVKYAVWDGFYDVPLTVSKSAGDYFKVGRDEDLNVDLYSYPDDPRVSILFDGYGNIAGLRTAYIKKDVGRRADGQKFPYSYDDNPMMTSGSINGTDVWYTSALFVSPEKLRAGGRKETGGLVAEDVYLKLDGKWTKIAKDECQVEAQGFTKQGCFIGMGMHYFYKVTPEGDCGDFQGAFLLYESGQLVGLGFNPFGAFTEGHKRVWFEDVPAKVVPEIVPNGPPCVKEWVSKYGATSFHIFFKRFPRLTFCTWPWQKSDQCKK